ncbi:MAG TPA: hypothetical protein GXZ65_08280 [Clostridiales bacterium]|jgi:hypothetical protein|nr:hypothetical protein [Clostridiales bacterium]
MRSNTRTKSTAAGELVRTVIIWGSLWGIFESTAGYLLHLLPLSLGWLVWYPAACFFMATTYERARSSGAILYVALLSACIKLINLLLPVRIDMVINPAVSIVFEAFVMYCMVKVIGRLPEEKRKMPSVKALAVISMNTGWRILYILYILLLVPEWMREISVISSAQQLIRFLLINNLVTSAVIYPAYLFSGRMINFIKPVFRLSDTGGMATRKLTVPCLLGLNILLQLLL